MARSQESSDDVIEVKVAMLGSEVKTLALPKDSTVADALDAAGYSSESRVKVSGEEVSPSDMLDDGDRMIVTNSVKGGC